MERFTLDEAFDILYTEILEEKLKEDISDLSSSLAENQQQLAESLDILIEAVVDVPQTSAVTADAKNKNKDSGGSYAAGGTGWADALKAYEDLDKVITKKASDMLGRSADSTDAARSKLGIDDYGHGGMRLPSPKPVTGMIEYTTIKDMKFPQNVIFFITQIVKWVKNNILNFIDKFSSIVRSMLGLKVSDPKFKESDLKLQMKKAKAIETKYMITGDEAYTKDRSFADILNGKSASTKIDPKKVRAVDVFDIDQSDISLLEGLDNILPGGESLSENFDDRRSEGTTTHVLRLDTSKDLLALRQSLDHFFDLFDNAFGSNDEKLFSVDDLEIMLDLFKKTMDAVWNPTHDSAYELGGKVNFGSDAISAAKLKDNLLRTRINTDQLKQAYVVTNKQINTIAQIIMNKNMLGASQMGIQFAYLSASTYEVMIELIKIIDVRLKEATAMDKKLQKMKKSYEKLTDELNKRRMALSSVSGMTYTTVLQKRINELFDGSRYMTETVQLRLNTLALYISELNDTRAILKNLAAVPSSAIRDAKSVGIFKKISAAFGR